MLGDGEIGASVSVIGAAQPLIITLNHAIAYGHKVALRDIPEGEAVSKYGIRIGHAIQPIRAGDWIHLHNCASDYDERSASLDLGNGRPTDTVYE